MLSSKNKILWSNNASISDANLDTFVLCSSLDTTLGRFLVLFLVRADAATALLTVDSDIDNTFFFEDIFQGNLCKAVNASHLEPYVCHEFTFIYFNSPSLLFHIIKSYSWPN